MNKNEIINKELENKKIEFCKLVDKIIKNDNSDENEFRNNMNNILDSTLNVSNSIIPLVISKHELKFGNKG